MIDTLASDIRAEWLNEEAEVDAQVSGQKPVDYDPLGNMLKSKWESWKHARRDVEEEWLKALRAFNQKLEPNASNPNSKHRHIYVGITRTKVLTAYARITDIIFSSGNQQWQATPTPVPKNSSINPDVMAFYQEDMAQRAKLMQREMEDQLLDMKYQEKVKAAMLESCLFGTGVVKGVVPGVKKYATWGKMGGVWDVFCCEEQFPEISDCSIFNIYADPYSACPEEMTGVFERHVLNRSQFSELKDNLLFDGGVIAEILKQVKKGNHTAEYHETERRSIANIQETIVGESERYDLLEYWGQVSGDMLLTYGITDAEADKEYWVNCWTCYGRTLLARIMPMKKQRIPYNFFVYAKVPHQFWGVGVATMGLDSQYVLNGAVWAMLDNMSVSSLPQAEVNVSMLKDGEDPSDIVAGKVWLRESGDPSDPAVRFYYPPSKVMEYINICDHFRKYLDEETGLPSYTHGDSIPGLNKTASGMSMLMGQAQVSTKAVIKNYEDYGIKPILQSLFDWNMEWSEKEEIKGDMSIDIQISSSVMAKEQKAQQLIQFSQLTANPIDAARVDRTYLLRELAGTLDIDADRAVRDLNGQNTGGSDLQTVIDPGLGGIAGMGSGEVGQASPGYGRVSAGEGAEVAGPMLGFA